MKSFVGSDVLSLKEFERDDLEQIFEIARDMETIVRARTITDLLSNKILATAFFQASTRTRLSFESAMLRLGGKVLGFADPKMTRAGDFFQESLEDTARMIESYADVVVIRHPKEGAPEDVASAIGIPVINGGDGYNEHPTQGLLDTYTIIREKGKIDGLKITLIGDMTIRVMHSLPLALARYDTCLYFVSTNEEGIPSQWKGEFTRVGLRYEEHNDLDIVMADTDVFYYIPLSLPSFHSSREEAPEEGFSSHSDLTLTRERLEKAKSDAIVLHPLPRTNELPPDIDPVFAARYFIQAFYGVPVRMALLALILGFKP
jgi:aspartate carbamoyltransferase catalytic subunit